MPFSDAKRLLLNELYVGVLLVSLLTTSYLRFMKRTLLRLDLEEGKKVRFFVLPLSLVLLTKNEIPLDTTS